MEAVLEAFNKYATRKDGKIEREQLKQVMRILDGTGFWTEERLEALFGWAGHKGELLDYTSFVQNVCATGPVDFAAVRADLLRMMDSPDWDDGSWAPILIRLAWHSSGTYSAKDGSGGSNGATMRYPLEQNDPENVGLHSARGLLEPLKWKYPQMSYSDLWILAAYVAIEHTGGPRIEFVGGRVDAGEDCAVAPGRLPGAEHGLAEGMEVDGEGRLKGWENLAQHIRDVFGRMGLSDREAVALIAGGHVYGRCHPESTGYNGAWVENPTMFSNEYCADMLGDKWMAVTHDTRMPDGGEMPAEVRPAAGKRQYIDMTKYEGEEEEEATSAAVPDIQEFLPGKYACSSPWVNVQESKDPSSSVIGRFREGQELNLLATELVDKEVRGQIDRCGWITIAAGEERPWARTGDLLLSDLVGVHRASKAGADIYASPSLQGGSSSGLKAAEELPIVEVTGSLDTSLFGRAGDDRGWVQLFSKELGARTELVVPGWNHKPRQPLRGQTGHQMMLVSDMVLAWDPTFRAVLQEYADDEELLKKDFGMAYKRLTELGCPWSKDFVGKTAACPVTGQVGSGCPVLGGMPRPVAAT
mmetsp:Transcript_21539/g.50212  ORF Transcript_21539/g.50212 Transcript_21539/m.50212 type:complete len:585 (+) Transcript_21539:71-1825(+)